jgi:hypothetical protein
MANRTPMWLVINHATGEAELFAQQGLAEGWRSGCGSNWRMQAVRVHGAEAPMIAKLPTREDIAKAMNSVAYAEHEASWAVNEWPRFLPAADAVLVLLRGKTPNG